MLIGNSTLELKSAKRLSFCFSGHPAKAFFADGLYTCCPAADLHETLIAFRALQLRIDPMGTKVHCIS